MNQVIKELYERKSVRAFHEREIGNEERELILNAAVQAPTAGNQQLYTILEITDQEVKDQLAVSCDHQPFIARAPLVLIFCADCQKWYDAYRQNGLVARTPGSGDLMLAVSDAVIAAQNAVTAAWSLGIGSCYIGDIMELHEVHKELLGLPDYVFPAAMLVFGYPTGQQQERSKPGRSDLSHIVHQNAYRCMEGDELQQAVGHSRGRQDYSEWLSAFCKRKYESDFSKEMTRSVNCYLEYFR